MIVPLPVASRAQLKNWFPAGHGDGRARHIARQRVGKNYVSCCKLGGLAGTLHWHLLTENGWPYILGDGLKHPLREPKTGRLDDWDKASVRPILSYTAHAASMQLVLPSAATFRRNTAATRLRRCRFVESQAAKRLRGRAHPLQGWQVATRACRPGWLGSVLFSMRRRQLIMLIISAIVVRSDSAAADVSSRLLAGPAARCT